MSVATERGGVPRTSTAAANTVVTQTIAAVTGSRHYLCGLVVSYSATPTAGRLSIESPAGSTVFDCDIVGAGPTTVPIPSALMGAMSQALIITLAAAGAAVVGKVNSIVDTSA